MAPQFTVTNGLPARSLAPSTINVRLAAIRKLVATAADAGLVSAETAAAIGQVRGARKLGVRTGNWLTKEQASQLLRAPDVKTLKGKRDRAVLGLLIGCGLRRAELAALVARGELEVPIAGVFALDDVRDAYRELELRHTRGKLVLRP